MPSAKSTNHVLDTQWPTKYDDTLCSARTNANWHTVIARIVSGMSLVIARKWNITLWKFAQNTYNTVAAVFRLKSADVTFCSVFLPHYNELVFFLPFLGWNSLSLANLLKIVINHNKIALLLVNKDLILFKPVKRADRFLILGRSGSRVSLYQTARIRRCYKTPKQTEIAKHITIKPI